MLLVSASRVMPRCGYRPPPPVKFRYPCDGFDSGTRVTLLGRGVDASGPSGGVRKGAVFFGRVVSGGVAADEGLSGILCKRRLELGLALPALRKDAYEKYFAGVVGRVVS